MKVNEFIEWLKTQDQDAEVRVLKAVYRSSGWDSYTNVTEEVFTPDGTLHTHSDYRNNPNIVPSSPIHKLNELVLGYNDG